MLPTINSVILIYMCKVRIAADNYIGAINDKSDKLMYVHKLSDTLNMY